MEILDMLAEMVRSVESTFGQGAFGAFVYAVVSTVVGRGWVAEHTECAAGAGTGARIGRRKSMGVHIVVGV
jgi:hypothetical protein